MAAPTPEVPQAMNWQSGEIPPRVRHPSSWALIPGPNESLQPEVTANGRGSLEGHPQQDEGRYQGESWQGDGRSLDGGGRQGRSGQGQTPREDWRREDYDSKSAKSP